MNKSLLTVLNTCFVYINHVQLNEETIFKPESVLVNLKLRIKFPFKKKGYPCCEDANTFR